MARVGYQRQSVLPAFPTRAAAVTPSDDTTFLEPSTIFVGMDGDVTVRTLGGDVVTFVGMLAGTIVPVLVDRVMLTGTDATNLVRIFEPL